MKDNFLKFVDCSESFVSNLLENYRISLSISLSLYVSARMFATPKIRRCTAHTKDPRRGDDTYAYAQVCTYVTRKAGSNMERDKGRRERKGRLKDEGRRTYEDRYIGIRIFCALAYTREVKSLPTYVVKYVTMGSIQKDFLRKGKRERERDQKGASE